MNSSFIKLVFTLILSLATICGCNLYHILLATYHQDMLAEHYPIKIPFSITQYGFQTKVLLKDTLVDLLFDTEAGASVIDRSILNQKGVFVGTPWITKAFDSSTINNSSIFSVSYAEMTKSLILKNILFEGIEWPDEDSNMGLIGKNILRKAIWCFDVDSQCVYVSDAMKKLTSKYQTIPQIMHSYFGKHLSKTSSILIPLQLESTHSEFQLDLGYSGDIFMNKETHEQFQKSIDTSTLRKQEWYGYLMQSVNVNRSIQHLTLYSGVDVFFDQYHLKNIDIAYSNKTLGVNLIGSRFMRRFNFILDYLNKKFYAQANQSFNALDTTSNLYRTTHNLKGIGFTYMWKKIIVGSLRKNGLAEKAGLQVADTVLQFNDIFCADTLQNLKALPKEFNHAMSKQTPCTLRIKNSKGEKTIQL